MSIPNFLTKSPTYPAENVALLQLSELSHRHFPAYYRPYSGVPPHSPSTSCSPPEPSASTHHIRSTITSTSHRYITPSRTPAHELPRTRYPAMPAAAQTKPTAAARNDLCLIGTCLANVSLHLQQRLSTNFDPHQTTLTNNCTKSTASRTFCTCKCTCPTRVSPGSGASSLSSAFRWLNNAATSSVCGRH